MTILCGTDFSPNAADAVTTAAALSRRFNDSLELVHATLPPSNDDIPPEVWLPVEAGWRERLEQVAQPLRAAGSTVKTKLETGTPTEVLRRLAKVGTTRLIVVASVGRVALARAVLGSTADRIAESAPVPTLVLRQSSPFLEWLDGRRPLRLLVAVDFTESSNAALGFAHLLAEAGPCDITVGCISNADDTQQSLGLPKNASSAEQIHQVVERDLREKVTEQLAPRPFRLAIAESGQTPAEGLIELAKEHRADLIVTGAHQHHGLSRLWHHSTSRALLADAPISVVVVPARARNLARNRIPRLNRVLVTTDLSPMGNQAIAAACSLLPLGGTVRLLHVVPPIERAFTLIGGNPKRPVLSPGEHKELVRHAQRILGSLFPAEAFHRRISPEVVVAIDADVPNAILKQARQFGAHAICLSSHGRGAVLSTLLGSVAHKVVAGSHRPVHLVRPGVA